MKRALDRINRIDYKTILIILFTLFVFSSILRSVFACFPKSLMIYPDEIRYVGISRSLFNHAGIRVHNVYMNFDQILYPMLLAPFNLIKDQILQINAMAVFNSILISSALFPVYLLGKKILKENSWVLLLLMITFLMPDLSTSMTFMSENLFYPLSLWLLYFVYQFWDSETTKDRILYCALSAVFCFLAYLTKTVAVYFAAAFVCTLAFDSYFTKINSLKQNLIYCIGFCVMAGGAILGYKIIVFLTLGMGVSSYEGNLRLAVYDFNTFIYFFYALINNIMFALLAFFYFPVLIPLLRFERFEKSERNMLVFAVVSMVVMIFIIALSISTNEDYPKLFIRQHTRYYAPLLILFLTLFFKERFIHNAAEEQDKPKTLARLFTWTVFFCMIVFSLFRFFSNVCIDGVLLQAISSLGGKHTQITGDPNVFHIPWQLFLVKSVLVLGIAGFTVVLLKANTKKTGTRLLVLLMMIVCVLNNYFSMKEFDRIYRKTPDQISQAIAVNQFVQENQGNVLIITSGYEPALDTYILRPVYWTKTSEIKKLLEGHELIDLREQKIISNYPSTAYETLDTVDYLITDHSVKIDGESSEEIKIQGLSRYRIYKSIDKSKVYLSK